MTKKIEDNLPPGDGELVYCAIPSRMGSQSRKIMDFLKIKGYAPFNPLVAMPRKYFEDNPRVGRHKTMDYCKQSIDICQKFVLFGISAGTIEEFDYAQRLGKRGRKEIFIIKRFDERWDELCFKLSRLHLYFETRKHE